MFEDYTRDCRVKKLKKNYGKLDLALRVRELEEGLAAERHRRMHIEVLNAQLKDSELRAIKEARRLRKDRSSHAVVRDGERNLVAKEAQGHDMATRFSDSAVIEYKVVAESVNSTEAVRLAASLDDQDYWEAIEQEEEGGE